VQLYLDWDGTVTERDSLHMVIERFGDLEVFHALEQELERELTLDEVISAEMATISAPFEEVIGWVLENVRVRPGFQALVERHDPTIVSAGFDEFILPVLDREGVAARVIANTVAASPEGWRASFRPGALCPVCGQRCKRGAVGLESSFIYVGDGISDRCGAEASDLVFARRGLAAYLAERSHPFEHFDDFFQIADRLRRTGRTVP
jgi:2-hydroxy-3-keto-5-methylthiopentenyl-1-phosphate phosphatase